MLDLLEQLSKEQKRVRITLGAKSYKGFLKIEGKGISIEDEKKGIKAVINLDNEHLIGSVTVIGKYVDPNQRRVYYS